MTRFQKWLYGLGSSIIGGSATALSAQGGLALVHTVAPGVQILDLKQLGATALAGGFWAMVAYLKQSPLPAPNGNTEIFTKPETKTDPKP